MIETVFSHHGDCRLRSAKSRYFPLFSLLCFVLTAALASGDKPDARQLKDATGIATGLAIHLGTTDGELESALAADGKMLVHGLALDDAARRRAAATIEKVQRTGLASVQHRPDISRLPYADNLANLVIADFDDLGERAPREAEVLRILAPRGVAYLKQNGKWQLTRKPLPAEMDQWPQYWHSATGNPVSQDTIVSPPTGVQWMGGIDSEGTMPQNGYRIADGTVVYEAKLDRDRSVMICRDAFNGLIRWSVIRNHDRFFPHFKSKPLLNVDSRIFTVL